MFSMILVIGFLVCVVVAIILVCMIVTIVYIVNKNKPYNNQ